ncbi:unnamed protein product, partial [Adineta steineri]
VLTLIEKSGLAVSNEQERKEGVPSINSKQIVFIRADQLLNLTITKTGFDLVQRLSVLFNDVYNKRLPFTEDNDQPMLSLFNGTGREIFIDNLDGLEFAENMTLTSKALKPDGFVPL